LGRVPSPPVESNDDLKHLLRMIDNHDFQSYGYDNQKKRNREIFNMYLHGVTLVQIAEEYGITKQAVSLICEAYKKEARELAS